MSSFRTYMILNRARNKGVQGAQGSPNFFRDPKNALVTIHNTVR